MSSARSGDCDRPWQKGELAVALGSPWPTTNGYGNGSSTKVTGQNAPQMQLTRAAGHEGALEVFAATEGLKLQVHGKGCTPTVTQASALHVRGNDALVQSFVSACSASTALQACLSGSGE